ncbi:UDP-N-acetylglucosamine 3-dehydrogenase [Methanocella arvoryzae]|uniref:Myo-inositol 2-dehydrogenase n=1 Tax=Methanocella arvoryzae (strain DSM 22066 / NBRC 105507 / MRE50) TaxID=351160 RepID=Q0W3F2_METAR|nr:UDP-N-acetylglucosamine 3-dehydrogenase [Methanocella arvoryzae]CAJ37091.1 putative myo-inositol 2-dehydrogenase [Methanocella arvoryzae MRE50]
MRVGVIGAGAMGQNHIRTYSQMNDVELVGIADVDQQRIQSLSKQYNTMGFTDYNELLKQNLDAVSIVVPTTLHRKVAIDAIHAGTNILVEKPIADTIENAQAITDAADAEGLTLMVGHIERFNPAVVKMKQIIDSGKLGKVVSISTSRVGPYNPRIRDVGVILDIGVHDIDIISYLYNSRVTDVYAIAGKEVHSLEDHASMFLRYEGDRAGVVEVNWLTPHKTRKFTVIGTEGVAYGDYIEQRVTIHDKEWVRDAKIEKREPLALELESFLDACKHHKEPVTTGPDGIHALDVAIAAIDSYKSRSMVKIHSARYAIPRADQPSKATV